MFKKVLNLVFNELELEKVEFGGLIITKPDDYYSMEYRDKSGGLVVTNFSELDVIEIVNSEICGSYISITRDIPRFYKDIPFDSHFKLKIDNEIIESLINNRIEFCIMTKNDKPIMKLGCHDEGVRFEKLAGSNIIGFYSDKMNVEVFIPEDSEIRIYV